MPQCFDTDCRSSVLLRGEPVTGPISYPSARVAAAEHKTYHLEPKSQQKEGLEHIASTLAQQQATLGGIVKMQEGLQQLLEEQHRALAQRLDRALQSGSLLAASADESPGAETTLHRQSCEEGLAAPPHEDSNHPVLIMTESHLPENTRNAMQQIRSTRDLQESTRSFSGRAVVQVPMRVGSRRTPVSLARYILANPLFDTFMGALIILNFIAILVEVEWKGYDLAYELGYRVNDAGWSDAQQRFNIVEKVFNAFYLFELILRLIVLRKDFFREVFDVCDGIIVVVCSVDSFILDPLMSEGSSSNFVAMARMIRILRALRVFRFLRVLRLMSSLSALRVLLKTITMSIDSLVWSMAVVGFIILAAAMLMFQLCVSFVEDDAQTSSARHWVYVHYGSAFRASYSMFEATFSAKWATHLARPLIEDVNPWFSVFWVVYIIAVNFAVTRIVASLFLRQAMSLANVDAERLCRDKMRQKDKIAATLRGIFEVGDTSGDGQLDRGEFERMMEKPEIVKMFAQLEMEPEEAWMLFDLISQDDNVADQEEFLSGALHLKANARTIDTIQVLHELMVTKRSIDTLKQGIEQVASTLNPQSPWNAAVHSLDEA